MVEMTKKSENSLIKIDLYSDYDEDRAKSNELERACIKCMRGLLAVMTRQREKIEQFAGSFDK